MEINVWGEYKPPQFYLKLYQLGPEVARLVIVDSEGKTPRGGVIADIFPGSGIRLYPGVDPEIADALGLPLDDEGYVIINKGKRHGTHPLFVPVRP